MNPAIEYFLNELSTVKPTDEPHAFASIIRRQRNDLGHSDVWEDIRNLLFDHARFDTELSSAAKKAETPHTWQSSAEDVVTLLKQLVNHIDDDYVFLKIHLGYCICCYAKKNKRYLLTKRYLKYAPALLTSMIGHSDLIQISSWPERLVNLARKYSLEIDKHILAWLEIYQTHPVEMAYVEQRINENIFTFLRVCTAVLNYSKRPGGEYIQAELWQLVEPIGSFDGNIGPQGSGLNRWFEFACDMTKSNFEHWLELHEKHIEVLEHFAQYTLDKHGPLQATTIHEYILHKLTSLRNNNDTDNANYAGRIRQKRAHIQQLTNEAMQNASVLKKKVSIHVDQVDKVKRFMLESTDLMEIVGNLIDVSRFVNTTTLLERGNELIPPSSVRGLFVTSHIAKDGRQLGTSIPKKFDHSDNPVPFDQTIQWHQACKEFLEQEQMHHLLVTHPVITELFERQLINSDELTELFARCGLVGHTHRAFLREAFQNLTDAQYEAALHKFVSLFEHMLIRCFHSLTGEGLDEHANPVSIGHILQHLTNEENDYPEQWQNIAWTWRLLFVEEVHGHNARHNIAHGIHSAPQEAATYVFLSLLWFFMMN